MYIYSRHKGGDVYSFGAQTDVHFTPSQLEHFDERKTFIYNVDHAAIEPWNQERVPWKTMCYRDMTGDRLLPTHRIARRNDVTPRPNQVVLADTIPNRYLDELATVINTCYRTVDSIELNGVREIRNVLNRIRMQSIRISEGDRTTVLIYPLYQSPGTPDTLRPLPERRSVLSWLSQVYQIPIVRDLVGEIPTLIPALRENVPAVVWRHEEAPHQYNLATQQICDEEVQQQLEQTQQDLHTLRIHTTAALNGLKQRQDVDRVAAQLQNSIVGAESMSIYIRIEQQNGLEYLSNVLSIAQQGRLPPQLHQQLQQILQPYRQNGQAIQFGKYPVTVQQVMRGGQIHLRVQLTTTRPMQWTMYRVHPFPLFFDDGNYNIQLPFRYFLLHHQFREYIPLDPEEALACQQGMCHPAQPRHQVQGGHCIIQILLGQNYTCEDCPYQPDYRETAFVSTAGGIAYSVKQPLLAYIHCLQDEFKREILKRIRIKNWGWIVTNPGCYLETPKRQTHPQPFNASQVDLSYHNFEQARSTNPRASPVVLSDCPDSSLE